MAGLCAQNNYISVANCSTLGPISYVPLGSPCPPFQAVFVNNTATAPGDGSYVYPYALLSDAQANSVAGDMIYVFTGDGTDTNYNTGFILKENQILTGSSTPFEYKGVIIEPLTSGPKPKISYSGPNNTIKTSCSCRVIGLDISSTGGNDTIWVYSPLSPPGSVGSIEKCSVSSENYNCIDLGDSNSNKTLYISNVVLFAKKASALIYDGNNSSFTWSLSDSVIESPTSPTSDPAIYIDIAGASNRISLTNNTINHPNESISISDDASSATFTLSIENNSLSSTSTSPIKCNIIKPASAATVEISSNTLSGITNDIDLTFNGTSKLTLTNNTLNQALKVTAASICFPSFQNNSSTGYSFNGYSGLDSTYRFTQSQPSTVNSNIGSISFTPSPGHTLTQTYSTPCP